MQSDPACPVLQERPWNYQEHHEQGSKVNQKTIREEDDVMVLFFMLK